MSGTSIVYGDRPIANVNATGGAYATFEFLQYLERLSASHGSQAGNSAAMQAQINTNTTAISTINGEISTLTTNVNSAMTTAQAASGQASAVAIRVPTQTAVAAAGAVPLTSGAVAQVVAGTALYGTCVLIGTVYLIGSGTVTLAQASVGLGAGVIESAPGAHATGWFGGGASPGSLGAHLSIGSFAQQLFVAGPLAVHLNVKATFSGAISAYGNLICWLVDG